MSNDLMLDVGQANELKLAFRRADYNNDDIKRLCEGNVLVDVRSVLRGLAAIEHVIDCDADPFVPDGLSVEEHQKGGRFKWDPVKVKLYLSKEQQGGKWIEGSKLREELKNKPVYNANLLDYLFENPHLIPWEWKNKDIFFWGTVYRDSFGDPYVRCLYWDDGEWGCGRYRLDNAWSRFNPAAVPAS